jgi:hypothetical protein
LTNPIINEKTIADFTRVVAQSRILERKPVAKDRRPAPSPVLFG